MKLFYINLFFLPFLIWNAQAQDYNYWKEGYKDLDFATEPPSLSSHFNNGMNDNAASVCNSKGELMFYLKDTVPGWVNFSYCLMNKKNEILEKLYVNDSSVSYNNQVLLRLNDSLYYYFYVTHDAVNGSAFPPDTTYKRNGVCYALINANSDGGKGKVTGGNDGKYIVPDYGQRYSSPVSATKNNDGSWWIITRNIDSLYAIKLDINGIQPPVGSYAPETHFPHKRNDDLYCRFKFSNDGKTVMSFMNYDNLSGGPGISERIFSVYDFDKATGKFSNQRIFEYHSNSDYNKIFNLFISSITFSPNDSFIYVVKWDTLCNVGNWCHKILQYERYTANIKGTEVEVFSGDYTMPYQTLELGQNGRIVVTTDDASNGYYGYIYRPNLKGKACQLIHNVLEAKCYIPSNPSTSCGFFWFPFSRYHGMKMDFRGQPQCDSTLRMANLCDKSKFVSYKWYIYGTTNSYADSATGTEPSFSPPANGRYWVKLRAYTTTGYGPWYSDTVEFTFPGVPKADFTVKTNEGCRYVAFEVSDNSVAGMPNPPATQSWRWRFSDGGDTTITGTKGTVFHTFTQTGTYSIKLVYSNGYCSDSISKSNLVSIKDAPHPGVTALPAKGCQPLPVSFSRSYKDSITKITYTFGDGSPAVQPTLINGTDGPAQYVYPLAGNYVVKQTLTGPTGCVTEDSVKIAVLRGFESINKAELVNATVVNDSSVYVTWQPVPNAVSYTLQRSYDKLNWKAIHSSAAGEFYDFSVKPKAERYFYRVTAYDTCGKSLSSNTGSTLLLTGENKDNEYSLIRWTPYEDWPGGIEKYDIEAKDNAGNWTLLNNIQNTEYEDHDFLTENMLEKCYRINAIEKGGYNSKHQQYPMPAL